MKTILVEHYLVQNGLHHVLAFGSKQVLVDAYPPSWIDTLKKGKSRVCYASNLGTLELLFEGQKLLFEHYDFQENHLLEEGPIVMQSDRFFCGATLENIRGILSNLTLSELSLRCSDSDCVLTLEKGVTLNFVEEKLASMSIMVGDNKA